MADYTNDPEIKCSNCGHTWSDSSSFELDVGAEVECPECQTVLQCIETDVTRHWAWDQVKDEKRGQG